MTRFVSAGGRVVCKSLLGRLRDGGLVNVCCAECAAYCRCLDRVCRWVSRAIYLASADIIRCKGAYSVYEHRPFLQFFKLKENAASDVPNYSKMELLSLAI
jgi:hypothetical protein